MHMLAQAFWIYIQGYCKVYTPQWAHCGHCLSSPSRWNPHRSADAIRDRPCLAGELTSRAEILNNKKRIMCISLASICNVCLHLVSISLPSACNASSCSHFWSLVSSVGCFAFGFLYLSGTS